jgi:predicted Zn-ribbon and HTH transcriptional regulator
MKKHQVKLVIAGACLALAVIIIAMSFKEESDGIEDYKGEIAYIKCLEADCGHVEEMDLSEYYQMIRDEYDNFESYVKCSKCGGRAMRVNKCPQCGFLFPNGAARGAYPDTCPECKYSPTQQERE